MVELLPVLGSLGGGGALVAVIVYLLGSNRADRGQAGERIAAANTRADEADARAAKARDEAEIYYRRALDAEGEAAKLRAELARHQPPLVPPPAEGGLP